MTPEEIREMIQAEFKRILPETAKQITDSVVPEVVTQVRAAIAEDAKPKILVTGEEYNNLMSRAGAISDEAKLKVADMVGEGRDSQYVTAELLKLATADPDATDTGGGEGNQGTGHDGKRSNTPTQYSKVEDVPDDVFARMVTEPNTMPTFN